MSARGQIMFARASAATTPPTTGMVLWLKSDTGTWQDSGLTTAATADTDPVGGWVDQSGSGNNFLQATSGQRPLLRTNVLNGYPGIRFDGSDDVIAGPNFSALTAAEIFIVVKQTAGDATNNGLWYFGSETQENHFPFTGGVIYDTFGTTARKTTVDPTPTLVAYNLYNVVSVSGEWTSFLNGTQLYTTATNTVGFRTSAKLGQGSSLCLTGDIVEVIMYNAKQGATDKSTVKSYIAARYGLTIA